jgi:hypothetical protein
MPTKPRRLFAAIQAGLLVLSVVATALTGAGLLLAAALKNDNLADRLLAWNPNYALAMAGLHTLEDIKYPLKLTPDRTQNVSVLAVTDPAWPVLLAFTLSEAAVRKSERNRPPLQIGAPASPGNNPTPASTPESSSIPRSSFDRAKTMFVVRLDVISAGDQPLAPPL